MIKFDQEKTTKLSCSGGENFCQSLLNNTALTAR